MDEGRLAELANDIAENGQREPIQLLGGQVIDGRNRLKACEIAGIDPRFEDIDAATNPWEFVWSLNGQRRDLTTDQRYLIWKQCAESGTEWLAERLLAQNEANEKRVQAAKEQHKVSNPRAGEKKEDYGSVTNGHTTIRQPKRTSEAKAAAAGVGVKTANDNDWLKLHRPDLLERVRAGEFGSAKARSIAKKEARADEINAQRAAIESGKAKLPSGKFEVVVMDPPWAYGRDYDPQGSRVANPYPEMAQDELLALDPPFAHDAVLFLWTTHQFIWDAKELLDNWGFEYKATLVWDKEKMGIGYWFRMQCEFCLVAIKGKPIWQNTQWRDVIREARREHSRKPEIFYKMVEQITVGRRLDFFSRNQRDGWEAFGNDTTRF